MKISIISFLLLISLASPAQRSPLTHQYLDAHQPTYALNTLIRTLGPGGNLAQAKQLLQEDQLGAPLDQMLGEALLRYQLFGKNLAFAYLDSLEKVRRLHREERDFGKLWLSYLGKNPQDEAFYEARFQKKHPESSLLLRLRVKRYLDYLQGSIGRKKEADRQALLADLLDAKEEASLSERQRVYLQLAWLDVSRARGPLDVPDGKDSIGMLSLCKLWEQFPQELDAVELYDDLADCDLPRCQSVKDSLLAHLAKTEAWNPRQTPETNLKDQRLARLAKPRQQEAPAKNKESWQAFGSFLQQNPFYEFRIHRMVPVYCPPIEDEADLKQALQMCNELIQRYPGCFPLRKMRIRFLQHYEDLFAKQEEGLALVFEAVVDLFASRQAEGIDSRGRLELIGYLADNESESLGRHYSTKDFWAAFWNLLSPTTQERLQQVLKKTQQAHPRNQNLQLWQNLMEQK
jgi:hypothetical protein